MPKSSGPLNLYLCEVSLNFCILQYNIAPMAFMSLTGTTKALAITVPRPK